MPKNKFEVLRVTKGAIPRPSRDPHRKHPMHTTRRELLKGSSNIVVESNVPTHTCKEYNTYPTFSHLFFYLHPGVQGII